MADVLDTVLQDMATLVTDANTLIADFQAEASGQISTSDPRWTTLSNTMTQLDAAVKAATTPAPTPSTPTPPPAGA